MNDFSQSVMVALLPTTSDWCRIALPHMTIVYVGEIPDLSSTTYNDLGKAALTISKAFPPITTDVLAVDILGQEDLVDVLLLRPTEELLVIRQFFESWNVSLFPFKPHATIGPMGSAKDHTPNSLTFDRIMVGWGDKESLIYDFLP